MDEAQFGKNWTGLICFYLTVNVTLTHCSEGRGMSTQHVEWAQEAIDGLRGPTEHYTETNGTTAGYMTQYWVNEEELFWLQAESCWLPFVV